MNQTRLYICVHCSKEHCNPARAAICCFRKNERWRCECGAVYESEEKASKCCKFEKLVKAG